MYNSSSENEGTLTAQLICVFGFAYAKSWFSPDGSDFRSKYVGHDVQLTATKQTKFLLMNVDENFLDSIYEPREVMKTKLN